MNTDEKRNESGFSLRKKTVLRRPFWLTLFFFLLIFGSYFAILLVRPGSPIGRGDGAADTGSGTAAGNGSGSGLSGNGHGGDRAAGKKGIGSGSRGKNESMGKGKEQPSAAPAPAVPAAPSTGKTKNAPPQTAPKSPLRHASPLAIPQEEFAEVTRSEKAPPDRNAGIAGSEGEAGKSGGSGGSGAAASRGFYGIKVRGNTIFLLDVSGSMSGVSLEGSRIELLKRQLERVIRSTGDGRYGIITFSSGTTSFPPDGKLQSFRRGYDRNVKAFVLSLQAAGGTGLLAGLQELKKMLDRKVHVKTVFLLTDGEPDDGWTQSLPFIRKEIPEKIVFNTISIGRECPEMKQLAKERKGTYKSVR